MSFHLVAEKTIEIDWAEINKIVTMPEFKGLEFFPISGDNYYALGISITQDKITSGFIDTLPSLIKYLIKTGLNIYELYNGNELKGVEEKQFFEKLLL